MIAKTWALKGHRLPPEIQTYLWWKGTAHDFENLSIAVSDEVKR